MREKDAVSREFFEDPVRFADLLNGYVYGGQQMITAEDVRELKPTVLRIHSKKGVIEAQAVTADVVKEVSQDVRVTVVSLENQTDVHYAMPVRVMNAESAYYHSQWRNIAKKHEQERDLGGAEFLSGFAKEDKLVPMITIVVYWGKDVWDGPRCMKEMLKIKEYPLELQSLIADYPIHLLEIRKYEQLDKFHTDIQYVFGFLQREMDKEELKTYVHQHREFFSQLTTDAYDVISVISHSKMLIDRKNEFEAEGGEYNMCRAIEEMIEEGKIEGKIEGHSQMLLLLLEKFGQVSEELKDRIRQETDLNILEEWFSNAVNAISTGKVKTFLQNMENTI